MNNTREVFFKSALLVTLALLVIGCGAYVYKNNEKKAEVDIETQATSTIQSNSSNDSITAKSNVTYSVSGNTLSVIVNGKTTQTIVLDDLGVFALNVDSSHPVVAFTTNKDINFDGYNDAIVLKSTGYAGVNYFYDVYFYNPQTERLEKSSVLSEISNPKIDITNKTIVSSYKSGSGWITETYKWSGSAYIK